MKQYIRKADIILFIVLVAAGLAASAVLALSQGDAGSDAKVVIESGGSIYARYSLYEDRSVIVPAPGSVKADHASANDGESASSEYDKYNVVEISGGTVSITEASCKNQVCVRHGSISHTGESIVCLPNRLVVSIDGGDTEGGGYDTVTS